MKWYIKCVDSYILLMTNRGKRGQRDSDVRGEILRPPEDQQKLKRLSRVCPLIKNES